MDDPIALALVEAARKLMEQAIADNPAMEAEYRRRFAAYEATGGMLRSSGRVQ